MIAPRAIGLPRSPPRDPGDIDGLTVWLEADRGVVLDASGLVSEWRDQSGRGNHATQATGGARPAYATDASGRRVVQTSLTAFMEIAPTTDTDPHATLGFTVYAAYASSDATLDACLFGKYDSATPANRNWLMNPNDGNTAVSGCYIVETGTNTLRRAFGAGDGTTGARRVVAMRYDPSGFVRGSLGGTVASTPGAIAGVKATSGSAYIGRGSATAAIQIVADAYAFIVVRRYLALGSADDVFIRDYLGRLTGAA